MTLNQIAEDIARDIGKPYDRTNLEQLKYDVVTLRAQFLRQDVKRNRYLSPVYEQDLGCIDLESTDIAECCDSTITVDCKVHKTTANVPTPLSVTNGYLFTYAGGIDKQTPYGYIKPEQISYTLASKYIGGKPYYYFINDRVYVFNSTSKYVNLRGVFNDPRDAEEFNLCDGADCYTDDDDFPITGDLASRISMTIIQNKLRLQGMPETEKIQIDDKTPGR